MDLFDPHAPRKLILSRLGWTEEHGRSGQPTGWLVKDGRRLRLDEAWRSLTEEEREGAWKCPNCLRADCDGYCSVDRWDGGEADCGIR